MKYLCVTCGAEFEDKAELGEHDRQEHQPPVSVYRVVNPNGGAVVADRLGNVDAALTRARQELERTPGGRFHIQVQDAPKEKWRAVLDLGGFV